MKIRLNVKLLLVLGLCCTGLAVCTHFFHAFQVKRNAEAVLRRDGQRHDVRRELVHTLLKVGRYGDAAVHLDELDKAFRKDAELTVLRGRTEEGLGRYGSAKTMFNQATEYDPKYREAYV